MFWKRHPRYLLAILFALLISAGLFFGGKYLYFDKKSDGFSSAGKLNDLFKPTPTPTPFPFQELTIPYLRNRDYAASLGEMQQISTNESYTTYLTSYLSDGFRINGLLTVPNNPRPDQGFPGVIFVHGYISPQNYQTRTNYNSFIDPLARDGLVVFKIDLRGHAQSEGDPGGAYYSSDYVIDTLNAYNALQEAPFVDPEIVGLWGHSMAGNVVFRAMAARPEIANVVIWAGAVYTYQDFSDFGISDNSYQPPPQESERRRKRQQLFETHGSFNEDSQFWTQVAATNYLDQIRGKIQIHHGVDDPVVNIGYSRNLATTLDEAGVQNQLFEYSSGGHNLTGSSFSQAIQRTSQFLKNRK